MKYFTLDEAAAHYNIDWAILSFATSRGYLKYHIHEDMVYIAEVDLDRYIATYRERCKQLDELAEISKNYYKDL